MNKFFILFASSAFAALFSFGQSERSQIREGNREFKKGDFLNSEISYRTALERNPSSVKGNFNLGAALYKQDKIDDAQKAFEDLSASSTEQMIRAKAYYNLGNALFNQKKIGEAADAYKNSLRLNPGDVETKYNLAQAMRMLQQQKSEQKNKGDGKDEKENDKKENKKDQQDKKQEDKQDNKQSQDKKQQQQQEQKISPEDARRMLEAIQKNEKDVQQKVLEHQAKHAKVRVDKNW